MIEHIVLFKVRSDATSEAVKEMLRRLRALKEEVPGILYLSCGTNFSERAQGYTHGLVVRFPDRDALQAYQVHPLHQAAVTEAVRPVVEEGGILALDYEI
ncbi:MAG: Dabb family protein [Armatimonadetes bacterium]|nr:Dabb family protein [Armatimonadota bacterium]